MTQQKRFSLLRRILICLQLFNWNSISLIEASEVSLTLNELRDKYGQGNISICCVIHQVVNDHYHCTITIVLENTTFNDERSCHRVCDGQIRTCYYEFEVQFYDSMSG